MSKVSALAPEPDTFPTDTMPTRSRVLSVLVIPWVATSRSTHWLLGVVTVSIVASAILAATQLGGQMAFGLCMGLSCAGIGVWWLMLISNAIWVARDATALRLPRIRRDANMSVWLYAVLTVAVPALLLASALSHPLLWLTAFALTAAGCLALLLLPSIVWIPLFVGQSILVNANVVHVPTLTLQELAAWLALLALVLSTLDVWLWRRMLDLSAPPGRSWMRPVIWNTRQMASLGFLGMHGRGADVLLVRSSRRIFTPIYDVSRTGPDRPIASIRVLLGRNHTPQTLVSHLRNVAISIVFILAFAVLPNLVNWMHERGAVRKVFVAMFAPPLGTILWPVVIACLAVILMALAVGYALQTRWTDTHGELPLLALLPGIGSNDRAKYNVLQASLLRPLIWLGIAFIVLCGLAAMQHMLATMLVYAPLCLASSALLAIMIVLGTLGGRPPSSLGVGFWTIGIIGLIGFTCLVLSLTAPVTPIRVALVAVWLGALAMLAWQASSGWRALRSRPHPFLSH